MGLAFYPTFERELPGHDPTAGDGKGVAVDSDMRRVSGPARARLTSTLGRAQRRPPIRPVGARPVGAPLALALLSACTTVTHVGHGPWHFPAAAPRDTLSITLSSTRAPARTIEGAREVRVEADTLVWQAEDGRPSVAPLVDVEAIERPFDGAVFGLTLTGGVILGVLVGVIAIGELQKSTDALDSAVLWFLPIGGAAGAVVGAIAGGVLAQGERVERGMPEPTRSKKRTQPTGR
jgi:hypothetical protein